MKLDQLVPLHATIEEAEEDTGSLDSRTGLIPGMVVQVAAPPACHTMDQVTGPTNHVVSSTTYKEGEVGAWKASLAMQSTPTNAYGSIYFDGSLSKAAKYIRLGPNSEMSKVRQAGGGTGWCWWWHRLVVVVAQACAGCGTGWCSWWRRLVLAQAGAGEGPAHRPLGANAAGTEPCTQVGNFLQYRILFNTPPPCISIIGGAKNFRLDGRKREVFKRGLIGAARATNAWVLSGGSNTGAMQLVGEAVREGQFLVNDGNNMKRGLKCIGICPWGYIQNTKVGRRL